MTASRVNGALALGCALHAEARWFVSVGSVEVAYGESITAPALQDSLNS